MAQWKHCKHGVSPMLGLRPKPYVHRTRGINSIYSLKSIRQWRKHWFILLLLDIFHRLLFNWMDFFLCVIVFWLLFRFNCFICFGIQSLNNEKKIWNDTIKNILHMQTDLDGRRECERGRRLIWTKAAVMHFFYCWGNSTAQHTYHLFYIL